MERTNKVRDYIAGELGWSGAVSNDSTGSYLLVSDGKLVVTTNSSDKAVVIYYDPSSYLMYVAEWDESSYKTILHQLVTIRAWASEGCQRFFKLGESVPC